jgi:hypothetical protein
MSKDTALGLHDAYERERAWAESHGISQRTAAAKGSGGRRTQTSLRWDFNAA